MSPAELADAVWWATVVGVVFGVGVGLLLRALLDGLRACRDIDAIPESSCLPRGMGQGPMCDLCRATYPAPSGGECPARLGSHASGFGASNDGAGRWIKRGDDPRPGGSALPGAHSRLRDNVPQALQARAMGADRG